MGPYFTNALVTGVLVLVALTLIVKAVRIVPEYQRLVVFRLGRALGARGPGRDPSETAQPRSGLACGATLTRRSSR